MGGASLNAKLGWRVYVCGKDWELYAYTIIGARSEKEALDTALTVITPGKLPLRARVATIEDVDSLPLLPR